MRHTDSPIAAREVRGWACGASITGAAQWGAMRVVFAVLVALALLGVPYAEPASTAPGVDLSTSLFNPIAAPVPDSPVQISVAVSNNGTATATNVVVEVPVPAVVAPPVGQPGPSRPVLE